MLRFRVRTGLLLVSFADPEKSYIAIPFFFKALVSFKALIVRYCSRLSIRGIFRPVFIVAEIGHVYKGASASLLDIRRFIFFFSRKNALPMDGLLFFCGIKVCLNFRSYPVFRSRLVLDAGKKFIITVRLKN